MSGNETITAGDDRLPWSMTAAAMVAMGALFITSGRLAVLPVLALLLSASHFTSWRAPRGFAVTWGMRLAALIVVLLIVGWPDDQAGVWYVNAEITNRVGCFLAAELVVRAWTRREVNRVREGRGVAMFIIALIMAAAANTYDPEHIRLLSPLFLFTIVLSLRSFSRMGQPDRAASSMRARRLTPGAMRLLAILLATGLGFSSVYAVTSYEQQLTRWAVRMMRDSHRGQTSIGLSSSPRLQSVFNPQASMRRILVIEGRLPGGHLRTMAFDTYHGGHWLPSIGERTFGPLPEVSAAAEDDARTIRFIRFVDTMDLLILPLTAASIESVSALERDAAGTIREMAPVAVFPYGITASTHPGFQGLPSPAPAESEWPRLRAIPPSVDPRVTELAREVAGGGEPLARVMRIINHLRGNHDYSLNYQPEGEPLSDFVLNRRGAHCQYFASALVVMARAAGVPARYVNGYYAHEPLGDDGMVVRDRDAHAWAECWIEGVGWMTFDATPPSGRPDERFPDASAWRRSWEWLHDLPRRVREWIATTETTTLAMIVGIPVSLWLVGWMLWKLHRRPKRPARGAGGYAEPRAELLIAARRFEAWLRGVGVTSVAHRTWREHLRAMSSTVPADSRAMEFVRAYDEARFGDAGEKAVARLSDALDHLEGQRPRRAT